MACQSHRHTFRNTGSYQVPDCRSPKIVWHTQWDYFDDRFTTFRLSDFDAISKTSVIASMPPCTAKRTDGSAIRVKEHPPRQRRHRTHGFSSCLRIHSGKEGITYRGLHHVALELVEPIILN